MQTIIEELLKILIFDKMAKKMDKICFLWKKNTF